MKELELGRRGWIEFNCTHCGRRLITPDPTCPAKVDRDGCGFCRDYRRQHGTRDPHQKKTGPLTGPLEFDLD